MLRQIEIKVVRLVDVDPFGSALPFVRVVAPTGEVQSTSTAVPDKSHSKYSFDRESPVNTLVFEVDPGNSQRFDVSVFSRESDSDKTAQYPGIGKIIILDGDSSGANTELSCPLYEDGDEMLEIGVLIYTYDFAEQPEMDLDADDFNIASLEVSPRGQSIHEPEPAQKPHEHHESKHAEIKAEPEPARQPQPQPDPSPTIQPSKPAKPVQPQPEPAPEPAPEPESFDDTDIFDREMKREEEMNAFLNDDDVFDELDSLGPEEELIVSPELHIKQEHVQDPEHQQALQTLRKNTIYHANHDATTQDWDKYADSTQNQFISDVIRSDLVKMAPQSSKITVRLHSAIFSSDRKLDTTAVTVKISLLPVPNKVVALRSVSNKPDADTLFPETPATGAPQSVSTTFSFGLKTAMLSMGAGDLRSKAFREGACPRLALELSLGGSEGYTAFTELYLPALLSDCSAQVLSIPLVAALRVDGSTEAASITSSLLFELNPADLADNTASVNNNNFTNSAPVDKITSSSRSGPMRRGSLRSSKSLKKPVVLPTSNLMDNAPAAMAVEFGLQGVCGVALEELQNLSATATLEAYLTSSGVGEAISLNRLSTLQNSPSALSIKKTFSLSSARPKIDILQLRLRNGPFPEDEIGRVSIPLVAFLQAESANEIVGRTVAFNAWKWSNSSVSGVYLTAGWKFIGSLKYHAIATPSVAEAYINDTLRSGTAEEFELQFQPDQSGYPMSALSATNNSTRENTWTSSPSRKSPSQSGFDSQALNVTSPGGVSSSNSNKPVLIKSVSGQLVGCVKGYYSARSVMDRTTNQEEDPEGSRAFLLRGTTLSTEVTLMPEGLRKKTNAAAPVTIASGDIDTTVEWSKGFTMFLAYAAQQRQVPYLQINVYSDRAASVDRPATRTQVASGRLDLSTLLSYTDCPVLKCLVPVSRALVPGGVLSRQDVCGWLLIGMQFRAAANAGDLKADLEKLEQGMQSHWALLGASVTQYCLGLSPLADLNTGAAVQALQLNPHKLTKASLHVALSTLQLASLLQVTKSKLFEGEEEVTCLIKVGNDLDCITQISGVIQNDRVVWQKPDAVLKFVRESSISLCLYAYLVRGSADAYLNDPAALIAEANMTLSLEQLQKGLPLNFILPLRDSQGERGATLPLSVQLTTIGDVGDGASDTTTNFLNQTVGTAGITPVPLRIEFCEGNIAESELTEHTEPFFECSLLLPEQEELLAGPNHPTRARTGFLRLSDSLEYWGLDCTLHVPPSSVAQIGSATSTILANSRGLGLTATNTVSLNNGVCIMGVVCRDASKQGCPEIGWARVSLPRQLILQGKAIEQWITLTPPNLLSATASAQQYAALPSGPGNSGAGKHSRMKLRITVDYKDYDAAYAPFGVGSVLVRMLGVHDARAGVNDDLVSAKVTAYAWDNGVPPVGDVYSENNMFSQLNAHPASYINEMAMFNEENLVGSLPVTGGFGDVKLNIKTFTTNSSYSTTFPIMATTTKASESGEMPPIPILDLNLSRERALNPVRARLEPQLQVAAVYVPYVSGKLVLHCTEVEVVTPPAELTTSANLTTLRDFTSPLALRYLLGNNSSKFMFSRPFELNGTSKSGNKKTIFGTTTPSLGVDSAAASTANVTFMEVDTFEVISTSIRRGESFSMIPLFVSLLEQWDLLDPVVDRRGQQACAGVGYVSTAALYYQALRAAAAAPMQSPTTASSSPAPTQTSPSFASPSKSPQPTAQMLYAQSVTGSDSTLGASPWLVSKVDIFDPKTKLRVAIVSLNIQFVMSAVPEHVVRMLGGCVSRSLADPAAKARMELGLKQSFVLADVDKSGNVSSAELLQVINNSGRSRARRTATSKLTLPAKGETIGMENAVDLLLQLANVPESELQMQDEQSLTDIVRKIFVQLDVDGDGLVSWWEWKSVLSASILGANQDSRFMHHMDALVIGTQAAHDALRTLNPPQRRTLEDFYDSKSTSAHSMLPYIRLKMKTFDNLAEPVIYEDAEGVFGSEQPSKAVGRLHSMVKSLRLTNSILAKRFERALSTAQNLSIDLDQDALQNNNGVSGVGASRQGAKLSEIEYLEARIHDTEKQSQDNLSSFLTAKERSDRLAAQLHDLQASNGIIQKSRSNPELYKFHAELEKDIQSNAERLRQAQELRRQRVHAMQSALNLKAMVAKLIMPKVRARRQNKAATDLTRMLQNQTVRRNYLKEKEKREKAALTIQSVGRGRLGRRKVQNMHNSATRAQNLYRTFVARRRVGGLKLAKAVRDEQERLRQLELKRNLASFTITRAIRTRGEHLKEQKNSAALRLQLMLRNRLEFKAARGVLDEKRAARDRKSAEEKRLADELAELQRLAKLREEEERRRQEAAKLLTKTVANRGSQLEGRKIHHFLATQRTLEPTVKPEIASAVGLWVNYSSTMKISPRDPEALERRSSHRHFGRGHFGQIQAIDRRARTMDVLFLYNKVEEVTRKSSAKFEVEKLPYDHPLLDYYTSEKPKMGYWVNYTERGEHHWLPFKPYTDRPDHIKDALGYKVGLKVSPEVDPDEKVGALYPGRIVAFDRAKDTVSILFDSSEASDPPEQEEVVWTSPDIQWLMPAAVSRPKTIEESPGYNVEVNKAATETTAHHVLRGTVIRCDPTTDTVRVVYAPAPGVTEATEVENLDFTSAQISWLNKVHPSKIPASPRPSIPHGPSFSKMFITTRPTDIMSTVGHLVEVKSNEENAQPGDMCPGVVVAADSSTGMVRVLYDSIDNSRANKPPPQKRASDRELSALSDGSAENNTNPIEDEEDFEDLHWMSPDILWVLADPEDGLGIDPRRPRQLKDCVGHQVDVLSHEPDAVEGDYFSGTIVSVSDAAQTVRVLFDGEGNGEDYEDIAWNSPDIHWLAEESVRGRDEPDIQYGDKVDPPEEPVPSPTKPVIPMLALVPHRPATLAEANGWHVKMGAELLGGKIVSVDAALGSVWVVFDSVTDAPAPLQVKIHWDSPHVEWFPNTRKPKPVSTPAPNSVAVVTKQEAPLSEVQMVNAAASAAAEACISAALKSVTATIAPTPVPTTTSTTTTASAPAAAAPAPVLSPRVQSPVPHLKAPPTLAAAIGWAVEIRASEEDDEVYVGEVAGVDEGAQTVKILFAGEDGTLQEDDAEFLPFTSDLLRWVEGPALQAPPAEKEKEKDVVEKEKEKSAEVKAVSEKKEQKAPPSPAKNTLSDTSVPAKNSPDKANNAATTTAPNTTTNATAPSTTHTAPESAAEVVYGKPALLQECIDRRVNIIYDFVPGMVTQTSATLNTVNLALQREHVDHLATLVVGVPFGSSMVEWLHQKE